MELKLGSRIWLDQTMTVLEVCCRLCVSYLLPRISKYHKRRVSINVVHESNEEIKKKKRNKVSIVFFIFHGLPEATEDRREHSQVLCYSPRVTHLSKVLPS